MIPWLEETTPFPPPDAALNDPNGLLAAGADLSPARLIDAYRHGIFPWFNPGDPPLWWSPDPRTIIEPTAFHRSRSLQKRLRRRFFRFSTDRDFVAVLEACATTPRREQRGTWITPAMRQAYRSLHELGYAHSVEAWQDGKLAGGVYGVAMGRIFFAESMFSHATDASKAALAQLAGALADTGYALIDCQFMTPHLASLGAREIRRSEFLTRVAADSGDGTPGHWPAAAFTKEEDAC